MCKKDICPIDEYLDDEEDQSFDDVDSDYPCDSCSDREFCDGWEARYCCTLCHWYSDEPDCDDCDPWDI